MKVPTLIFIDPKDELVHAKKLELSLKERESGAQIEFIQRDYLKGRRPGKYHILFHPDYFSPDDWDKMIEKMDDFITKNDSSSKV